MKTNEIIKQLESLKLNQEVFIPGDDTGVFERDVKALEEAIEIIKRYDDTKEYIIERLEGIIEDTDNYLEDRINFLNTMINYSVQDNKDKDLYEYSMRKFEVETIKEYIEGEVLKDA